MDETIWMCGTCLQLFIGRVPPAGKCPGCTGDGRPLDFSWHYAIEPSTGRAAWTDDEDAADGELYI